jgi:TM2 domain-containing membrane protein YozV
MTIPTYAAIPVAYSPTKVHPPTKEAAAPATIASQKTSHLLPMGYGTWVFGAFGLHRFYYGRPWTGLLWFFTGGLLLVGWIIDAFLIPSMQRSSQRTYRAGPYDYTIAWLLLLFLGVFGGHRFFVGKWVTGLLWLVTGGLLGLGWLYDLFTLNDQISQCNVEAIEGNSGAWWE